MPQLVHRVYALPRVEKTHLFRLGHAGLLYPDALVLRQPAAHRVYSLEPWAGVHSADAAAGGHSLCRPARDTAAAPRLAG
ncbi:hypothetical protein D3C78_1691180 [compost metagenome]